MLQRSEWEQEIHRHLDTAHIFLLLISPSFMSSDYCYGVEMQHALARYERGEALVIPIIVRPVVWQNAPFGKLQVLPKNAKPVISWKRQEEAFLSVVEGIQQAIEGIVKIGTTIVSYQSQIHHIAEVMSVTWSPDGKKIASASLDHTIQIRDVATRQQLLLYTGHDQPRGVAWSPDGKDIASCGGTCEVSEDLNSFWGEARVYSDSTVRIWNAVTGRDKLVYTKHEKTVSDVAWSPDGKYIASASEDATVHVCNAATGNGLIMYQGHDIGGVSTVSWSPDGKYIASVGKDIQIWGAHTGTLILTHCTPHIMNWSGHLVSWSPDGKCIAFPNGMSGDIHLFDVEKQCTLKICKVQHHESVSAVAWSPNGNHIAFSSKNSIQICDSNTGKQIFTYSHHSDRVRTFAWSPSGKYIASSGKDTALHIWQAV